MTLSPVSRLCGALIVGIGLALSSSLAAQVDKGFGTWKLNLAKSKYETGAAPTSEMRIYEAWEGDGVKATFTVVGADGKTVTRSFTAHYDGKDNKYTGSPDYDVIALRRVDGNTTESSLKKGGNVVQTTRTVISGGGKVRTNTVKGIDAKGRPVSIVAVFEKQ
jgi:hypothetical protein